MSEWKEVRLGEWMQFNPSRTIKKGHMARKIPMDSLVPYSKTIDKYYYEPYKGGAKFQNGDTIMARITPCLENGKHAFISLLDQNETAFGSTEYIVMCGIEGISDNDFVYYLTHTPFFKNHAIKSMVGSSGRQRAQVDVLQNLIMLVPTSLIEQRRIAAFLSSLDSKIENNRKICANLEAQAQALFKHWFIDFAPFKDGKFVESELGMIPEGWRVGRLGELIEIKYGKDHKKLQEGAIPAYGSAGLMRYVDSSLYKGESVLIPRKGTLNNVMLVNEAFWTVDTMFYTIPKYEHLLKYVFLKLSRIDFTKLNVGTSIPSNSTDQLNKMAIVIPPNNVLKTFDKLLNDIFVIKRHKIEESSRLSTLRDTLLPKLMSGEIKV